MQIGNEYPNQGCAAGYQLEAGSILAKLGRWQPSQGQVDIAGINLLNGPVAQLDDVTFGTGQNFHLLRRNGARGPSPVSGCLFRHSHKPGRTRSSGI
jgi:hypothetical protein